ncbi:hypothetical protein [Acidithiobacillus thiooxidans]|uniref:t-SNARE coiled-coil homology domain-containing protein n=1 Tax=Acidithiobacillus thiooxidans TaxID=930 RepID=A0A1C2IPK0_ACITH|nr:hypothetical protein [Acidithiobacillus thiooxidans]OCX69896.1 hypothetical protein A6M23_14745 [Acidithiobacillus thiooxidans]OCX77922.1 hypothetical protein A6P08_20590 [Acidithiobacillus thiooxidans]
MDLALHDPASFSLFFIKTITILRIMDIQETIDSLRKVLESVIAPGVESLRLRLDAVEKDLQENGQRLDRLDGRMDQLSGRMDYLAERVNEGFSRVDGRIDTLGSGVNARVDHLAERMEDGFSRMDTRLDALTSAILTMRQPTYPDMVLTRLEKLEQEVQNLRKS